MKKIIFSLTVFTVLCVMSSCGGKKTTVNEPVTVDTFQVDTLTVDTTVVTVDSIVE